MFMWAQGELTMFMEENLRNSTWLRKPPSWEQRGQSSAGGSITAEEDPTSGQTLVWSNAAEQIYVKKLLLLLTKLQLAKDGQVYPTAV